MVGGVELMLILVMLFLLFGPQRLGEFGRALGEALREYSRARAEVPAPKVPTAPGPGRIPWQTREQQLRAAALQLGLEIHDRTPEELARMIGEALEL